MHTSTMRFLNFVFPEEAMALEAKLKGKDKDLRNLKKSSASIGFGKYWIITRDFVDKAGYIPGLEL